MITAEELEQVFVSHRPLFRRAARRILHDEEDVNELIQETFLRVWRYRGEFRDGCSLTSWIVGVLRRVAFDTVRARKRRMEWTREAVSEEVAEKRLQDGTDIEGYVLEGEVHDLYNRAYSTLTPRQKEVIDLYLERGSIPNTPVNNGEKMTKHHAIKKMRRYVTETMGRAA